MASALFKTGCNELVGPMQQLIYIIWLEESMPSVLCPVLKKGATFQDTDWTLSVRLHTW